MGSIFCRACAAQRDTGGILQRYFARPLADADALRDPAVQDAWLELQPDESIMAGTEKAIGHLPACVYKNFMRRYHSGAFDREPFNCNRVWPVYAPDAEGLVAPHLTAEGNYFENKCSFFVGHLWLQNQGTYATVRELLLRAQLDYRVVNLLEEGESADLLRALLSRSPRTAIFISNIDWWFKDRWPLVQEEWKELVEEAGGALHVLSTNSGGTQLKASPHAAALRVARRALGSGLFLEVTTKVEKWGFWEYDEAVQRVQVPLQVFLGQDPPCAHRMCSDRETTVLLHILAGEGTELSLVAKALRKACSDYSRVLVLEHNRASADWVGMDASATMLSLSELRAMARLECKGFEMADAVAWAGGEADARRNMLLTLQATR